MYCPRCKVETEDTFCEKCGGATVASSEVASTIVKEKLPFTIQEERKEKKIRDKTKFSFKKSIKLLIVVVILIGALMGYKTLQTQYTPLNTTKVFYNYIVKKDYDNAYKMLTNTDDQFTSKDMFESYMKQKDIKSFKIQNYNANTFNAAPSQNNIKNSGNMFTVQANETLYPIDVVENGSKFIFFKNYKIKADNFSVKWQLIAPTGAKVMVSGKTPYVSNEPNTDVSTLLNDKYKPSTVLYQINEIFNGSYDVTATMEGADKFKLVSAPTDKEVTIKFNPSTSIIKTLQEQAKAYLDLYYSNATQDKYTSIITTDNDIALKLNSDIISSTLTNKLQDIKINTSSLDDVDHATINVKCGLSYVDSSTAMYGQSATTGTKEMTTDFYFQRVNGKWLISDTGDLD
ncbi:hypothetical protein [Clostridium algidicarnis]|uniref:hypothetical protein n=1 Tax=Clostridium algidicarnis TaxID=37659 RepID=UPI003FD73B19